MRYFAVVTLSLLSAGLFAPIPGKAQIYAFANSQQAQVILRYNNPRAYSQAVLAVARSPRTGWYRLLHSNVQGHGSIFCASRPGGADPHYFVAEGKANGRDAVIESRSAAQAYARGRQNVSVYWCGLFNNTNRFPLTDLTIRRPAGGNAQDPFLRQAEENVDKLIREEDKRERWLTSLETALTTDPREVSVTQAEAIAKSLLQYLKLDTAKQLEEDALAADRKQRIENERKRLADQARGGY